MRSPWEVLGVPVGAGVADVKAAHRHLCRRYHPDRFVGAPESVRAAAHVAMAEVNDAAAVLLAAARGWAPPAPGTAVVRHRPRNRWDVELAGSPTRGQLTDLAA